NPVRVVIAIDALSVIAGSKNPVTKLTVDQIGKIYRGEIKNWKDVGGEDMPITIYGRQSNSGTYEFMKDFVMKGEYASGMRQMNGNAQIVEAVKQDSTGIGYVGVGYAKEAGDINVMKVAVNAGGEYVDPFDSAKVKGGYYPITRPLNQYMSGVTDEKIKDFIKFELSAEGQKIVEDEGFFAIPEEYKKLNAVALEG
ncbi:MAG: PstS family phosphate ABC transporter substrate-binding protein, partial [Candidatus Omnitrophica bacterium]|nr:PstS family phosphate ABC transporter substrate-binding protein [Candidatus Omnitrophota bacterium]